MTFMEMIYKTLEKAQRPLSMQEIWEKAGEYGFQATVGSAGKTPVATISARLHEDLRKSSTEFVQVNKRPALFTLKKIQQHSSKSLLLETRGEEMYRWHERDLHSLLTVYVSADPHFMCLTKTIYHETSKRAKKGENEWLHPDIVGVHFSFMEYQHNTVNLIRSLNENVSTLFSFEMKIRVNFGNLREYYFQAVSNSSWANEGYLVAVEYQEDPDLRQEMQRLTNAFGIGFIQLDVTHPEQSQILLPARRSNTLDWDTIDRLVGTNEDFRKFTDTLVKDLVDGEARNQAAYDRVLSDENELRTYQEKKGFLKNQN